MHPQLRQMPPRCSRSTTAVLNPSCAARIAVTYPPGPAPMTMMSYWSAMFLSLVIPGGPGLDPGSTRDLHPKMALHFGLRSRAFRCASDGMTALLNQHPHRVLDEVLQGADQSRPEGAVDGAVVTGEGEAHHRRDRELALAHHRPLLARADGEDGRVRRVDDCREVLDAEHAEVRDRGRAALVLLGLELAVLGTRCEVLHGERDLG